MTRETLTLKPGAIVENLRIESVLGSGAFATTYVVTDNSLGSSFALKEYLPRKQVLRSENGRISIRDEASKEAYAAGLDHFLNEGRMVAALDHPCIVKVLRYFEANGTAYLLMPCLAGETLQDALANDSDFDSLTARKWLFPLLEVLEYLHEQNVVHQDIKPSNIFIRKDDKPLLLDFGAAAANAGTDTRISRRLGSSGYAAPEQSNGEDPIGPWTDFYGLAATLYRCISGQVPAAATQRLAAKKAGEDDPLVSASQLPGAAEHGGFNDFVDHGLELDPQARPRSAREWRKSFDVLAWRRSVAGKSASAEFETEGKEWLPMILLGAFLITMSAVGIYLLIDPEPEQTTGPAITIPGESSSSPKQASPKPDRPPTTISAEETSRWQTAVQADTVLAYRRFISDYPDSVYLKQAQIQLDILDDRARDKLWAENTRAAFMDYLEQFPGGRHEIEAFKRIDEIDQAEARAERERLERERLENQAWETARISTTIAALDRYIQEWPAGVHIEEARSMRRRVMDRANDNKAFQLAEQLNTREAFQAYIDAFPQGNRVTDALAMLDGLTFRPGKKFRDCALCPEMVVIPAGSFWQGSREGVPLALGNEQPARLVNIASQFAASIHEVTMDQFDACVADQGCSNRPGDNGWGRGSRPVIMVSWNDAQEYIQWLNSKFGQSGGQSYRLPSESEWEYFARAGEESDWLGGDAAQLCEFANIAGEETGFRWRHEGCEDIHALGTIPAASLRPNAFGLYDVIGNVAEWTSDCMNLSYLDAPVDGSAWGRGICSSHTTRGGSWVTGSKEIRLPARFNLKNGDRNDFTGFRVVRTVEY